MTRRGRSVWAEPHARGRGARKTDHQIEDIIVRRLLSSGALLSLLIATGCGGDSKADGLDDANALDASKTGQPGPAGQQGAPGPAGDQGLQGATGAQGDPGATGAQGATGAAGQVGPGLSGPFTGIVTGASGPVAGANVALMLRALDGTDMGLVAAAVTAADGSYSLRAANISSAATTLVLRVSTEDGMLSAILSGSQTDVSVASTAIERWVDTIVAAGSLHLSEFTTVEIAALVSDAQAALVADATDLTDHDAVITAVTAALEPEFAAAANANFSIGLPPNPVTVAPADVQADIASFDLTLVDGVQESWDITADGQIADGTNDAYDDMFFLSIDGNGFPAQTAGTATAQLEDGRELVLGPVVDLGGTGLTVTRKIHISDTQGFARFLEILSNPGAADVTVPVLIDGNLGSDESNNDVFASSSGDTVLGAGDSWFTNHQDSSDPAVGFLFPGAVPSKSGDDVAYEWSAVTVPAGGTTSLVHWGFQKTGTTPAAVTALTELLSALPSVPPASYWAGMSSAEAASTQLLTVPALHAGAGAVAPSSTVTVTINPDGLGGFDSQFPLLSGTDGSLSFSLPSGTTSVEVTTANGTAVTLTNP
jgi:hypothetical protein